MSLRCAVLGAGSFGTALASILAKNGHEDVVNCVALCPTDPEIMVSVGDDCKTKIWISNRKNRTLNHELIYNCLEL